MAKMKMVAKAAARNKVRDIIAKSVPSLTPVGSTRMLAAAPAALGQEMRTRMEFLPSPFRTKYRDAIRIRGTEWIGPVVVPAGAIRGQCLRNDYVQPQQFVNSRLAQFGLLYEKFLFQELKQRYTPSIGSGQAGSILLAYDRDISDPTPPASEQGIRQYMSWEDTVQGNVWAPHELTARLQAPETGFYTDEVAGGDDRLSYQGQFYVALVDPLGNASDVTIGNTCLEYVIDFFVPQLQAPLVTGNFTNSGGTGPAAGDAFIPFASPQPGAGATAVSNLAWRPTQGGLLGPSQTIINLAEGTYRILQNLQQTGAGVTAFTPSVITPKEPEPAPAPQPLKRTMANVAANVAGDLAYIDELVAVPRGGGVLSRTMTTLPASVGSGQLLVEKIGPYMSNLVSIF